MDHQYSKALNIYLMQLDHKCCESSPPPSNGDANDSNSASEEGSKRVLELIRDHSLITEACVQKNVLQVFCGFALCVCVLLTLTDVTSVLSSSIVSLCPWLLSPRVFLWGICL